MDPSLLPFVAFTTLSFVLALVIIFLKRQNIKLASQLQDTLETLNESRQLLQHEKELVEEMSNFKKSMVEAQLTTRLQTSRGGIKNLEQFTTPEKYQYIYKLTQTGMDADEIASVLSISRHEAAQLVSLAHIANKTKTE